MIPKHIVEIIAWLRQHGAENVRLEHRSKHPKLYYTWRGVERFHVLPWTPGDRRRGVKNALSDLRHALGLVALTKRIGARRASKSGERRAIMRTIPVVTMGTAWQTRLQCHPLASPLISVGPLERTAQNAMRLPAADPLAPHPESLMTNPTMHLPEPGKAPVPPSGSAPIRPPAARKMVDPIELERCRTILKELCGTKPRAELMNISPAMATAMLERNTANRPKKEKAIVRYGRDLKEKHWVLTNQTVGFSDIGVLVDGQNRLLAILASGETMRTWVIFGCDRAAFRHIDTGEKRRIADVLAIMKEGGPLQLAAMLRGLNSYLEGDFSFKNSITVDEAETLLSQHPRLRDSMRVAFTVKNKLKSAPTTVIGVSHYIFDTIDRDLTDQFFNRLKYGADVSRGDPELVLRDALNEHKAHHHRAKPLLYAMMIRAWNARREGSALNRGTIEHGVRGDKGDFPIAR